MAIRELLKRAELTRMKNAPIMSSTKTVRRYLGLHLARLDPEVFRALLLNTRHRFIAVENIFLGSIDRTMVYPREVVKCCLRHNAAAVVLFHNHVSYKGLQLQIPVGHGRHYVKRSVRVHEHADGRLSVFHGRRRLARYDADGAMLREPVALAAG